MRPCQARVTTLGEEMSLRFLKREAKLCGFLQRSFLALEQRMKASEGARLQAEGSLRRELDGRWQKLQEQSEERAQAQREQEGGRLLAQCRGLDAAVVQLTKFVRQNQVSLNRVLLAEQKARWVSWGRGHPVRPSAVRGRTRRGRAANPVPKAAAPPRGAWPHLRGAGDSPSP